jgi:hypothetical protein
MEAGTLHEREEVNMPIKAVVTAELARMLGVSTDRIVRAHRAGKLPEVGRAGHHRIYSVPEDVEMVRRYFEGEKAQREVSPHAGGPADAST